MGVNHVMYHHPNMFLSLHQLYNKMMTHKIIFPALPISFRQKLQSTQVKEGQNVSLLCEISRAEVVVEWRLAGELLQNGDKFLIKQRGTVQELILRDAVLEDSGVYMCICRELKTKATVRVIGRSD